MSFRALGSLIAKGIIEAESRATMTEEQKRNSDIARRKREEKEREKRRAVQRRIFGMELE